MNHLIWNLAPSPDQHLLTELSESLHISTLFATLLAQRSITSSATAHAFFKPALSELHDPFLMADLPEAVDRLWLAIQEKQAVLLFGDYDVDGTTAVALMAEQLAHFGLEVRYYIPDRYKEGYGLSQQGIDFAIQERIQLLITLDCGIKSSALLQQANDAGIDTLVCDHHQPDLLLPPGLVLDPKRPDCHYPYKELSGCAVAFKLLQGLYIKTASPLDRLFQSLDLVALAIGADIVELLGENRILCAHGLQQLNAQPRPAFQELLRLAAKKLPLQLTDVVFTIAPRINAAGRIQSGKRAVDWMLSKDPSEIVSLATQIEQDNLLRRQLEQDITQEALHQLATASTSDQRFSTVVFSPDWHKGVIGIVASRLIETHYRPTIVLTQSNDVLVGSARSAGGLNLYKLLDAVSETLIQFGGHQFAAGLSLHPAQLEAFSTAFEEAVQSELNAKKLQATLEINARLDFQQIGLKHASDQPRLMQLLAALEPCGPGNRHPVFFTEEVIVHDFRVLKEKHLKLKLSQANCPFVFDAIAFGFAHHASELTVGSVIAIAYQLETNTFNGRSTVQLQLKDLRY
ncbi:MAG: hypothetical protein RLZZ301_1277 [Bacteroidota bacterium]|jgi:single-stranded-DNA-specific exonuclease